MAIEALKKGLCCRAEQSQSHAPSRHTDRALVPGRGPDRAEEQDHETIGQARDAALSAAPSTHQIRLYFRGNLPAEEQGGRPRPAVLQHRYDEPASGRDISERRAWRSCRDADGQSRLAPDAQARASLQHLHRRDPSKCSELNPQENIWQFMRDNWLSNRVLGSYDDIADHCCDAWNKLVEQPWKIMSIGLRSWAQEF